MATIAENLTMLRQRVHSAAIQYQRDLNSVQILAVSKLKSIELIREAIIAGQRSFGENYVQEAITKITALADNNLEWHFIGAIQSNKTRTIASHFAWVHTVSSLKVAKRLSEQRPAGLAPLNVCIEVNVSGESSKSGIGNEAELFTLAQAITTLPHLKLRGLMCIPAANTDFTLQRLAFKTLRLAYEQLQQQGLALDTLSMGMTNDLEAAIAEGSTLIRVGTGIFGER